MCKIVGELICLSRKLSILKISYAQDSFRNLPATQKVHMKQDKVLTRKWQLNQINLI